MSVLVLGCGATGPLPANTPLRFTHCGEVECAQTRVPFDWSCTDDCEGIRIEVRRLRAPRASRGQLWALDGGPGFAGDAFFDPLFVELVHDAGYDLYVPTHRGAAGPDRLGCDAEAADSEGGPRITDAELPGCRDALVTRWGDLAHFGSVAAGHDVAHLLSRAPDAEHVVIYGGSYGSLWAQRALQSDPDAADLVWLDSIVDLDATLENADAHADLAARSLLTQCEASGDCPIDVPRAEAVLAGDEVCGASTTELRALGFRLLGGDVQERVVLVLLLAAAERCEPADRDALAHAVERFRTPPPSGPALRYAPLLNQQIVAAELDGGRPPTDQSQLLASRGGDLVVRRRNDLWDAPHLVGPRETRSAARMILWSGGLDPLDPPAWAERTAERWGAEHVHVQSAGHSVIRYARTADGNCAHTVLRAVLADLDSPLDRSCLDDIESIDWRRSRPGTGEVVRAWLGE